MKECFIDHNKLISVLRVLNGKVTEEDVESLLLENPYEGDEWQEWLDESSPQQLADWILAQ